MTKRTAPRPMTYLPFTFRHGTVEAMVDKWGRVFRHETQLGTISPHAEITDMWVGKMHRAPYTSVGGFKTALLAASWVVKTTVAYEVMAAMGDPVLVLPKKVSA